jgi:hypothetical protein
MADLKPGTRVTYTGTLTPRLTGKSGTVSGKDSRNGWIIVDIDGEGLTKCAAVNLTAQGVTTASA